MTPAAPGLEHLLAGALTFALNFALVVGVTAVGATVNELSGVLNLGHEGILLLGASVGFVVAYSLQQAWLGLTAALLAGLLMGVLKATWSVVIKTEQVINGLLMVPIGVGLANVLYASQFARAPAPPLLAAMPPVAIPYLHEIPVLGPALFNRSLAFYLVVALVVVVSYFLGRTRTGMIIRAAGGSPEAVNFNGVNVDAYRFLAVLIGTSLAGLAGAMLALDQIYIYDHRMTAGRGWIAIAIVIAGGWRPWACLLAALIFGVVDMVQFQFQVESAALPYEVLLSLPYLATIAMLAFRRSTVRPPAALGVPFFK